MFACLRVCSLSVVVRCSLFVGVFGRCVPCAVCVRWRDSFFLCLFVCVRSFFRWLVCLFSFSPGRVFPCRITYLLVVGSFGGNVAARGSVYHYVRTSPWRDDCVLSHGLRGVHACSRTYLLALHCRWRHGGMLSLSSALGLSLSLSLCPSVLRGTHQRWP